MCAFCSHKVTQAVLIAFAFVFSYVRCSDNSVEARENINYPIYLELDEFLSGECEEHEECAGIPTCQKTCSNTERWKTMVCAKVCVRGCVCEEGYVRNDVNGICVGENACPRVRH